MPRRRRNLTPADRRIGMSVTAEEEQQLNAAAAGAHMLLATWAREVVLWAAAHDPTPWATARSAKKA